MMKTTFVNMCNRRGFPTVLGDHKELCDAVPEFLKKNERASLELEYQAYGMSRMKHGHIHDKWPVDSILYHYVSKLLQNDISREEAIAELTTYCKRTLKPLSHNGEYQVILFLPEQTNIGFNALLDRIYKRRSDIYGNFGSADVTFQNFVFRTVGELCDWKTFTIRETEDLYKVYNYIVDETIIQNVPILKYKSTKNLQLTVAHPYAVGWDLPCSEEIVIQPGEMALLKTGISAHFPSGCYGMVIGHPCSRTRRLEIQTRIINGDYRGEISVGVKNGGETPYTVMFRECIAQLIVEKFTFSLAQRTPAVCGEEVDSSGTDEKV